MAGSGTKLIAGCMVAAVVIGAAVLYQQQQMSPSTDAAPAGGGDMQAVLQGGVSRTLSVDTTMGSPVMGSPGAPITIIEFGDYQCHACHAWFHDTKPEITSGYIDPGKANLVFVDLAFLGRDSPAAAQASHCAGDQGMYWEYHDLLYTHQEERIDSWAGRERLSAFAFSLDLDMQAFSECVESGKYSERVRFNMAEAAKIGADRTPTFVIEGPGGERQVITGAQPYRVFAQVLDSMAQ